ncbi:GntR family transcriptional regulator [Microbacterium sp. 10M-3C3]|uniref:GntR family transcriptional regulator n=1 Tax=Microbacterium sp. 10M-3C3 TaxID=2483401 RepID=UPI00197B5131|nr:GntR family transcriptional regulator [Microbacterium sp. 10M-3C3]
MADDLRARIVRGELPDGSRLVEESLAEEYDVSRGPVRDAIRQLAAEQLVRLRRGKAYVRHVGPEEVAELYALRMAIEPLAMTLAAERGAATDWQEAERLVAEMIRAADAGSWGEYAEADLQFHDLFYRASGSDRLRAVWELYQPTFRVMIQLTTARDADLHPSARSHEVMLGDVRAGRLDDVLVHLEEHLRGSRDRMLGQVSVDN